MTRLGLGTYGVAWAIGVPGYPPPAQPMDASGFLRFAHQLGLKLVQIADNLPLHQMTPNERAALKAEADKLGIAVEVGTRGIDSLPAYLAIAQEFESPILRIVVDAADDHPAPDEIVTRIRPLLADFTAANVTLAIENHDRFRAQTLADVIAALDHPNVGICLDTVNSFGSLEGPEVVVKTLGRYVVNLHVKEFFIRRADHNMGFTISGAPAGQGMLNMPRLLDTLRGYGREFNAIIEHWPAPEATMEATIAKESEWVHQSVAYLQTLILSDET